jgi:hypothetical protein
MEKPPPAALKVIGGGRLRGMTDVNPQWRYKIMTDVFGPCGFGWYPEIVNHWIENIDNETCVYVRVNIYIFYAGEWSKPIPGVGGSKTLIQEKNGAYVSDEAYKMAYTDAISVAMKMLGIAAKIYEGLWDGSRYRDAGNQTSPTKQNTSSDTGPKLATEKQCKMLYAVAKNNDIPNENVKEYLQARFGVESSKELYSHDVDKVLAWMESYKKESEPTETGREELF